MITWPELQVIEIWTVIICLTLHTICALIGRPDSLDGYNSALLWPADLSSAGKNQDFLCFLRDLTFAKFHSTNTLYLTAFYPFHAISSLVIVWAMCTVSGISDPGIWARHIGQGWFNPTFQTCMTRLKEPALICRAQ